MEHLSKSEVKEVDKELVRIFQMAAKVEEAYFAFVAASDGLAATLGMDKDKVLIRTLPGLSKVARREEHRVTKWVELNKTGLTERLVMLARERAETENRKKVLSEMNISNADKTLLMKIFGLNGK